MKVQQIAPGKYVFYCPRCQELHQFNDTWDYNGDPENPFVFPCIKNGKCGLFLMGEYLWYYLDYGTAIKMVDIEGPKPLDPIKETYHDTPAVKAAYMKFVEFRTESRKRHPEWAWD